MPQTALPNLGINYDFDLGAGGWKAGMDTNLFILDRLAQGNVISQQDSPPPSQGLGDAYIVGPNPNGVWSGRANEVAIWNGGSWFFSPPREGWEVYDQVANAHKTYNGSSWEISPTSLQITTDVSGSGRTLLAGDRGQYIRMTGNGTDPLTVTVPPNTLVPFSIGTKIFVTQTTGSTVTLVEGTGVTLNTENYRLAENHSALLIKVGTDEWDVKYFSESGWVIGTAPVFDNIDAPTSQTNVFKYKLDGRLLHWKIRMDYSGLDVADVSQLSITPDFPFSMVDRYGIAQLQIPGSTGVTLLSTDTFHASYNQTTDSINLVDNSGAVMTYDSGKIAASGVILLSGSFEV